MHLQLWVAVNRMLEHIWYEKLRNEAADAEQETGCDFKLNIFWRWFFLFRPDKNTTTVIDELHQKHRKTLHAERNIKQKKIES